MAKKAKVLLSWNNVEGATFDEMMEQMADVMLAPVPEGIKNESEIGQANILLGRLANQYAFAESMKAKMSYSASTVPRGTEAHKERVQKRDALESIASALKLKYQAVSRMLTIAIGIDGDPKITGPGSGWASVPGRR